MESPYILLDDTSVSAEVMTAPCGRGRAATARMLKRGPIHGAGRATRDHHNASDHVRTHEYLMRSCSSRRL
jgi:hypothetical protein